MSADFAGQEIRETAIIAKDPALKDVFTVKCKKCKTVQSPGIRLAIALDINDVLAPKERCPDVKADPCVCCPSCGAFEWTEADPHSLTAKRAYAECSTMELDEIKKKYKKTLRQDAKILGFAILYGASGYTIADRVFKDTSEDAVHKGQELIDRYFENNPCLKAAMDATIEKARACGYVEVEGGYRRHLPDLQLEKLPYMKMPILDPQVKAMGCFGKVDLDWVEDSDMEKLSLMSCPRNKTCPFFEACANSFKRYNIKKLVRRAERQAFNCLIQSGCAYRTNVGLLKFARRRIQLAKENPEWEKVKVISQIYDAVYLLVPDSLTDQLMPHLLECMEWRDLYVPHYMEAEPPAIRWSGIH